MMEKGQDLMIFSEFPIPTYDEWKSVTEKSLRGKPFDVLMTRLQDDLILKPMYQKEDIKDQLIATNLPGQFPYTRGHKKGLNSWRISQELTARTPQLLNELAKADLDRGQDVYHILLNENMKRGKEPQAGEKGVPLYDQSDIEELFANLNLPALPVHIDAGEVSLPILAAVNSYMRENYGKYDIVGIVAADPLHQLAKEGKLTYPLSTSFDHLATAVKWAKVHATSLRTVLIQTDVYHNGGASPTVQLAAALSTGVAYVQALVERGVSADDAGKSIVFSFSFGSDYFTEIAKVRAARTLWAAIMAEFGACEEAGKMIIHGRTSAFTKASQDMYVNILRGASEAFSAAAAGVDSLHVSPFDETVKEPSSFSRRIARNTSLILKEESHIDKTIDPAGGSWYVESVTKEIAKKGWELFQQIEGNGGIVSSLQDGLIQQWIDDAWKVQLNEVENRKRVIVGLNKYVNIDEGVSLDKSDNYEGTEPCVKEKNNSLNGEIGKLTTMDDIVRIIHKGIPFAQIHKLIHANGEGETAVPIPKRRLAESFEQLRKCSEEIKGRLGSEPRVVLLGLGPVTDHKARIDFMTDVFESGGFKVEVSTLLDPRQLEQPIIESSIVVLCGTDEGYKQHAHFLIAQYKKDKTTKVFIAGQKQEDDDALEKAGLDGYVHRKTNVYSFLNDLQTWIGGDE
ncbi:hypothetical protein GN156_02910 [bacterium LRH843]|nr:hypothetical protein [bacterium LRH843]